MSTRDLISSRVRGISASELLEQVTSYLPNPRKVLPSLKKDLNAVGISPESLSVVEGCVVIHPGELTTSTHQKLLQVCSIYERIYPEIEFTLISKN